MLKSGLALAFGALVLSPYGPLSLVGTGEPTGRWTAEVRDDDCGDVRGPCLQLTIKQGSRLHNSSWSFQISQRDLRGIDLEEGLDLDQARFELPRPAGTFKFDGRFDDGDGRGQFEFVANGEFVEKLKRLGYGSPSPVEVMTLAAEDVSQKSLAEFAKLGYAKDGIEGLVNFGIHGVTSDYVRDLSREGSKRRSVDDVVSMRIHGVDRELSRALAEAEIEDVDDDDLVSLKIHGVDLGLAKALRGLGAEVDVDGLVALQIQGITPSFIEGMASAGIGDLDVDDLVSMKVQGIDPKYVRDMVRNGMADLDVDELVSAKVQGLDGEYLRDLIDAGLKDLDIEDAVSLKIQGVAPDFVRRYLRDEPEADADELVERWLNRDHGRRIRSHRRER